jgi:DNA modification methylase
MKENLLIEGDGRILSSIPDDSVGCIITDHPYDIKGSNKGGNRNFASFECFRYDQRDFDEKYRVLKQGHFLVEFLAEENGENFEYLYQIKKMAEISGFQYYASVPWEKVGFVSNCGRKSKNTEMILIFSKGKARSLRIDAKKTKATGQSCFMSGTNGMLPTTFSYAKPKTMLHQAEKPYQLIMDLIKYVSKEDDVVLDQFAGSGSTGEACLQLNRRFILIEIDPETVSIIEKRLKTKKQKLEELS